MERELDESGAIEEGRPSEHDADVEAPPRAFAPATPFGDTKPFAGSLIDPTDPRQPEEAPAEGAVEADEEPPADHDAARAGEAGTDDFAARNVIMSNALPPDASAAAGALSRQTDPYLEPATDEERLADEPDAGRD